MHFLVEFYYCWKVLGNVDFILLVWDVSKLTLSSSTTTRHCQQVLLSCFRLRWLSCMSCPFLQFSKELQPLIFVAFILTSALSVSSSPAGIEKGRRKVVHVLGKTS